MKNNKSKNIQETLKGQLDDFLKKEEKNTQKLIYSISLVIFSKMIPNSDIVDLYSNDKIDNDTLNELVNYYDGATVRFPSKSEWRQCLMLTLIYYLRSMRGLSWEDVKTELKDIDDDIDTSAAISLGLQLKYFSKYIYSEFGEMLKDIDNKDVVKNFVEFLNNFDMSDEE